MWLLKQVIVEQLNPGICVRSKVNADYGLSLQVFIMWANRIMKEKAIIKKKYSAYRFILGHQNIMHKKKRY